MAANTMREHINSMRDHSDALMGSVKECTDVAIKDSLSISSLAYMGEEELRMVRELDSAMKHADELCKEYIRMLEALDNRFDQLERRLDRIDEKVSKARKE